MRQNLLPRKPLPPMPETLIDGGVHLHEPAWLVRNPRIRPLVSITSADNELLEVLAAQGWTPREAIRGRRDRDTAVTLAYLGPELRYGLRCYDAIGLGDVPLRRILRRTPPDPVVDAYTLATAIQLVVQTARALGISTVDGLLAVEKALVAQYSATGQGES